MIITSRRFLPRIQGFVLPEWEWACHLASCWRESFYSCFPRWRTSAKECVKAF